MTSSFYEQDSLFATLYHKTNRNRSLEVRVVFDDSTLPPSNTNGTWSAPCEVIGLESKKAKYIQLRFNPSIRMLAQECADLGDLATVEAKKYLAALISDSEWSLREPADNRHCMINRLSTFILNNSCFITISNDCFLLNWILESEDQDKKHMDLCKEVKALLHSHGVAHNIVATVTDEEEGKQTIELLFKKGDLSVAIFRLKLENSYLQPMEYDRALLVSEHGIELRLSFMHSDAEYKPVPHIVSSVVFVDKQEKEKMLDAGQLRVETLRRRLDESLIAFQKSAAQKDRQARSLHIVRLNPTEAMVEIGEHGARPRLDRLLSSSSPLNVICDVSAMGDFATSPSESIDSGVSLSPVLSPIGKHSPFYQYSEENRLGMRQRSASESEWASEGLKGILKKPSPRANRLARSVSESCHDRAFGPFGLIATLEEEDEDLENESQDENCSIPARKKRVSFSEKLEQCRRFRPNQCIATQARKNEKKRQQKRRKEEEKRRLSCGSESEHLDDDSILEPIGKPCLRNERQDSGFVDKDDSPPSSPLPDEERLWSGLIRQQRKMAAM